MSWLKSALYPLRFLAWKGVKVWVRRSFPSVPAIATSTLAAWMRADTPLLLDVRKPEEYAVSHLPSAYRAETVAEAASVIQQVAQQRNPSRIMPIVLYCSIGYRSGRLGAALQTAGYEVANLEGSIFQWASEGRSLTNGQQQTNEVHPYSKFWGWLRSPVL